MLTVNTGSMFSGKSTLLISQGEKHMKAGQRVLYVKPSFDNRYSEDEIVTHTGQKVRALSVDVEKPLIDQIRPVEFDVILIDEVQFFKKNLADSVLELLYRKKKVYASGLDMDFKSDGFETTKELMAIADKVNKLKAICEGCEDDAVVTGKRAGVIDEGVIQLGAKETYIPLCRECYYKHFIKGAELHD